MKDSTMAPCQHPFLHGMDERQVQVLLQSATEEQFHAGQIIFREGDPANRFYLIESGSVAVEAAAATCGVVRVQTLSAGDVLGWSWLFPPFAWHFQARALERTRALCCDGALLLVNAEEHPLFGYALMKRIAQILIQRLQSTRNRLVQSESLRSGAGVGTLPSRAP